LYVVYLVLCSFPTRRSSDLVEFVVNDDHLLRRQLEEACRLGYRTPGLVHVGLRLEQDRPLSSHPTFRNATLKPASERREAVGVRSEEHTSELQSRENLVCRL